MKVIDFIKNSFENFSKREKIFFSCAILITFVLSTLAHDEVVATVSAVCGITYTILAGKGKVLCYYIGIIGTLCYCYFAYKNSFFGNCLLYGFYYFPMEIVGIINWSKHLKENTTEIIKQRLSLMEAILYYTVAVIFSIILGFILKTNGGHSAFIDSITTVFSILGLYLTVKRCIEQWHAWIIVNFLSSIMWIIALMKGAKCLGTVMMWTIYSILAVYFLIQWHKELKIAQK